ncbi:MAG TPA: hypothetical protein ENN38_01280 [Actinobacteria bacterium]|nr:hypothetical protein [Actinomycetota bacterium]
MKINLSKTWKLIFLIILFLELSFLVGLIFVKDSSIATKIVSILVCAAYFIYIIRRPAPDVLWGIISLPFGLLIFYKAAGFSLSLTVLLSVGLAFLTLILLPWILYRG